MSRAAVVLLDTLYFSLEFRDLGFRAAVSAS
jgi:hypothetical protein